MFDLIPFEHKNNDLFRYLDDMERAFFGGNVDIAPCKTDIVDEGSKKRIFTSISKATV